jgi:hypothetical protein
LTKFEEQSQSPTTIITNNQQRNEKFTAYSANWEKYKEDTHSNTSRAYTLCGEYLFLVDLGIGIVPHAMLAYYDDMGGWWDLLLCELLTGHTSGAWIMDRVEIHKRWIAWFEREEGEAEAPYKLVGEAKKLELWMREGGQGRDYAELG